MIRYHLKRRFTVSVVKQLGSALLKLKAFNKISKMLGQPITQPSILLEAFCFQQ